MTFFQYKLKMQNITIKNLIHIHVRTLILYVNTNNNDRLMMIMWRSGVRAPSKAAVVSLSKTLYPYCLVLVGSRNGFERDFTIELK